MLKYRAKKQFGQNFLRDVSYIEKIIEAIPKYNVQMVEIGVGLGDLSKELVKLGPLVAYEVDRDLCSLFVKNFSPALCSEDFIDKRFEALSANISSTYNVTQGNGILLFNQDVLAIKHTQGWLWGSDYMLVANLPYYIATRIILRALHDEKCQALVVMTQKEVAHKFCANMGERVFCALSVLAQSFGKAHLLFDVPKEAFNPSPKVTSSVFCLEKRTDKNTVSIANMRGESYFVHFEAFLRKAFCAPRKKLANNLQHLTNLQHIFTTLNISLNARPNEVSTEQYHQIFQQLQGEYNGREYAK